MANVTTTIVEKPVILVNSVAQADKVVDAGTTVTVQSPSSAASPVSLTFTAEAGATIRYTLGGKFPTLGSPVFTAGTPVVVRKNGNGNSSDNTIIKAKSYLNGEVSETTVLELKIIE